jgi:hypothetical protein
MTTYVVLLPGAEDAWERSSPERRAEVYERHERFARTLAERGHRMTGGAELTHSRTTRTLTRGTGGDVLVTDGPFAEATEQLTGFYLVESDDVDDLVRVCHLLVGADGTGDADGAIEVRAAVDHPGGAA